MQPRSVELSHPTTPTRTVCHSTGNSFNLIQPILSRHIHSLTQHVTFTPFSGFLSLMPLSLAWLHPLILSVRCALRSRAISRLLSHAAPHLAHSHAHAHAKTEMVALPLSLAHLRLPRTNRTDREVHDLWIRRGVEPADHKVSIRRPRTERCDHLVCNVACCCSHGSSHARQHLGPFVSAPRSSAGSPTVELLCFTKRN